MTKLTNAKDPAVAPAASRGAASNAHPRRRRMFARGAALGALATAVAALSGSPALAASADGCPNADFREGAGTLLPDCRAYERVSPRDKNGADVGYVRGAPPIGGGAVAANGDAAAFLSEGAFADYAWGGLATLAYLSQRDATGWYTTALYPPSPNPDLTVSQNVVGFSPDFGISILNSVGPLTTDTHSPQVFYQRDNSTGALQLLSESSESFGSRQASLDATRVAFDTEARVTDEAGQPESAVKVYETAGQPRLVSRDVNNEPIQEDASLGSPFPRRAIEGAVSDDGTHIFFSVFSDGNFFSPSKKIYRRSNGAVTVLASPSKRSAPDPNGEQGKAFNIATGDGNRVFFTSVEQLTDDANSSDPSIAFTGDLYRYDIASDSLINLSSGTAGSDPAEVQAVVDIGDAGDRVYYVALGRVVPGEGAETDPKLYLWEDDGTPGGATRFIATLDTDPNPDDENASDAQNWAWDSGKVAQASDDGSTLLFQSRRNLTGYDQGGLSQVFAYDADANGGAGDLRCLSCGPGDGPLSGASSVPLKFGGWVGGTRMGQSYPRAISADGDRALFSTPNALLPRDTNGESDVYLWQGGQLSLISSGTSSDGSYPDGMSASGDDVFFRTRESLVFDDGDTLIDLYTARVGGGLASQQLAERVDCEGQACQGQPGGGPSPTAVGSVDNRSAGNVGVTRACGRYSRKAAKLSKKARGFRRRAARLPGTRGAKRLRHRAAVLSKQTKRQRAKAKRCRAANRGSVR